ncbi:MAG TPA: hypothetical protein VFN48_05935 [Solirubrobacteraceae bacterium]|nr:hypothetical protein [Solirubrobacteraceae bacterium]
MASSRIRSLALLGLTLLLLLPASASAAGLRWRAQRIESVHNGGLGAVSCADLQVCVAGDASGHVLVTTRIRASRWSAPAKVDGAAITGLTCPTIHFCAAVDQGGGFISSTQPTRGARYWSHPVRIDANVAVGGGFAGFAGISCPAANLCVAVDDSQPANVFVSSDPTGGRSAWHSVALAGPATSVDCPTTKVCVVAGSQRYVSVDPTNLTSYKASGALGDAVYSAVDCVGVRLCVGVGFGNSSPGFASATRSATGTWSQVYQVAANPPAFTTGLLDAVGCTRGTCVTLDGLDNAYVSSTPVAGTWGNPAPIRPRSASQSNAISCTSGMCVVVDSAGVETTGLLR